MSETPEDFIVRFSDRLPRGAEVLDVAAGAGRHALFLARAGCRVLAMDRDVQLLETLARRARQEGAALAVVPAEVENMTLLPDQFDVIVNTLFLYRPLFRDYVRALRPGGWLFFRTFTRDNMDVLGHERPGRRFLLEPGELRESFPGLEVIHYDESVHAGRAMATLVARRPQAVTE